MYLIRTSLHVGGFLSDARMTSWVSSLDLANLNAGDWRPRAACPKETRPDQIAEPADKSCQGNAAFASLTLQVRNLPSHHAAARSRRCMRRASAFAEGYERREH